MFYLKKLSPLLALILIFIAFNWYQANKNEKMLLETDQKALITAKLWLVKSVYGNNNESRYLKIRDSLLGSADFSLDLFDEFLKEHENSLADYHTFSSAVKKYVDSLSADSSFFKFLTAEVNADSTKTKGSNEVTQ